MEFNPAWGPTRYSYIQGTWRYVWRYLKADLQPKVLISWSDGRLIDEQFRFYDAEDRLFPRKPSLGDTWIIDSGKIERNLVKGILEFCGNWAKEVEWEWQGFLVRESETRLRAYASLRSELFSLNAEDWTDFVPGYKEVQRLLDIRAIPIVMICAEPGPALFYEEQTKDNYYMVNCKQHRRAKVPVFQDQVFITRLNAIRDGRFSLPWTHVGHLWQPDSGINPVNFWYSVQARNHSKGF